MKSRLLGAVSALAILVSTADAQSPPAPALYYNYVPTAGQWNAYFSAKADYPGILSYSNVWTGPQTIASAALNGSLTTAGNLGVSGTLTGTVTPLAPQFTFFIGGQFGVATPAAIFGDCVYGSAGIVCTKSNGVPLAAIATIPSASNLTNGTLASVRMPAFSGDVVTGSGSTVTTIQPGVVTGAKTAASTLTGANFAGSTIALSNIVQATPNTIVCNTGTATATLQFCGTAPSAAIPVINLAASGTDGVTGNLPVGNLNGGVNASGGYWRGDGTWAGPPGSMILLNTLTGSGASLSDTTSLTSGSYSSFVIIFTNILPDTTSAIPTLQVHNSGAFRNTLYQNAVHRANSGGSGVTNLTSAIAMNTTMSTLSSIGFSGRLIVSNPSSTTTFKQFFGVSGEFDSASTVDVAQFTGYWSGGFGVIDGFQFLFSSGNIIGGTIKVYGVP